MTQPRVRARTDVRFNLQTDSGEITVNVDPGLLQWCQGQVRAVALQANGVDIVRVELQQESPSTANARLTVYPEFLGA